jgi:hypothetical protein
MSEITWNEVGARAQRITWAGEKEGEFIFGIVEEFKEITRKDGTIGNVLTLTNEETEQGYTVWAKSMLLRLLQEAKIGPGMLIKIEYRGMQAVKASPGKKFRAYKLYVAA